MIKIDLKKSLLAASGKMLLDIQLELQKSCFVAVTGPSGSGKTTLLRLLAGLETASEGYIEFEGVVWLDTQNKKRLPTQKRNIGFVFQDYALFPNMSVRQNLEFALDKKPSKNIINELMEIMEIQQLRDRRPGMLSGGQKQRVALARALVRQPQLLLLDEPLSALDAIMRARLQDYIMKAHEHFNLTTILVSHNDEEIAKMATRVIRIVDGKVVSEGTPKAVFNIPSENGPSVINGTIVRVREEDNIYEIRFFSDGKMVTVALPKERLVQLRQGDWIQIKYE